jgi:tetratricopeptide (TPR) repeat protein
VLVLTDGLDDRVTELFKGTFPKAPLPDTAPSAVAIFCVGRAESSNDRLVYRLHSPPKVKNFEVAVASAQLVFDDVMRDLSRDAVEGGGPWRLIDKSYAARLFNIRGLHALESDRDPESALNFFDCTLNLSTNDPVLLANKASSLGALGRYAEAVDTLDLALKLDAGNESLLLTVLSI